MEEKYGSLIRAARAGMRKGQSAREPGGPQYSMFVAPRRGMIQLVEALVTRLAGCHVHCNQRVESLRRVDNSSWQVEVVDMATRDRRQETFDGVILALPAYHAARC